MKNLKKVFLLMCLSVFVISCSDATDEDLGTNGEGTFTANVAGTDFESLKVTVGAQVTNGVAAIQGSNSQGNYIRINIASYTGVGTYKTGNALSNLNSISYGTISPVAMWMSTFDIGSGTIEITEDTDSTISGTFSFTGFNASDSSTKNITNGSFSAPKN